jgi:hypothetical protein
MHKWFATCGTMKNQFNSFFEGNSLAFDTVAIIEVMVSFVF